MFAPEVYCNPLYFEVLKSKVKYNFLQGGTRSGKTIALLQLILTFALLNKDLIISCVSMTLPHVKRGVLRDFKFLLSKYKITNFTENKSDLIFKFTNGSIIEFFSVDDNSKVHGSARDILLANEIQYIDYESFFQLCQRTRKRVYADYNPTFRFWVHDNFIDNKDFKERLFYHHSTIYDNKFIEKEIIKDVEDRAKFDENYRKVYLLGEIGQCEGLIYKNFYSCDVIPEDAQLLGMWLDFGYSNSPSACGELYYLKGQIYVKELFYLKGLMNTINAEQPQQDSIENHFIKNKVSFKTPIVADRELKSINDLRNKGYNIFGADKKPGSVQFGISLVKKFKINYTKESENIRYETNNYIYDTHSQTGEYINEPVKANDHHLDGIRYLITYLYVKGIIK